MFGKEIWFHGQHGSRRLHESDLLFQSCMPDQGEFRRKATLKKGILRSSRTLRIQRDAGMISGMDIVSFSLEQREFADSRVDQAIQAIRRALRAA